MNNKINELLEMCAYIAACSHLDMEATLDGCGTNSFEAYFVVREILKIFEIDINSKEFKKLVSEKIEELE